MAKTKPPAAGKGRPKGAVNKTTASVKEAIEYAAQSIGGATRLADWAKEAPENEKVFWSNIYPKLLPLQVTGPGGNTPVAVTFNVQPVRAVKRADD